MLRRHVLFIIDFLKTIDPTLYLDEMRDLIIRFFGRKYRIGLICATLIRFGVTRKKLSLIADRRNEYERSVYMQMVQARVQAGQVVCFDEARIDAASEDRDYARGEERRVNGMRGMVRGARGHSVLAVLSLRGMLDVAISSARGITGPAFMEDFEAIVLPRLGRWPSEENSVVLCDNAIIHYMPDLHRLITAAGALLLYLPSYGYDKQPVEKVFSKTRLWLARNREISRSDPRLEIRRACMSVTHRDAAGYFQSCGIEVTEIADGLYI